MSEETWRGDEGGAEERKRLQSERFPPIKYPVLDTYVTTIDGQEVKVTVYSGRSIRAVRPSSGAPAVKSTASSPNCSSAGRGTRGLRDFGGKSASPEDIPITSIRAGEIVAPPLDFSYFARRKT